MEIRAGRGMLIVDEEESAGLAPPRELRVARRVGAALGRRRRLLGALAVVAVVAVAALLPRDGTHASVAKDAGSSAAATSPFPRNLAVTPLTPGIAPGPAPAASDYDLIYAVTAGPYPAAGSQRITYIGRIDALTGKGELLVRMGATNRDTKVFAGPTAQAGFITVGDAGVNWHGSSGEVRFAAQSVRIGNTTVPMPGDIRSVLFAPDGTGDWYALLANDDTILRWSRYRGSDIQRIGPFWYAPNFGGDLLGVTPDGSIVVATMKRPGPGGGTMTFRVIDAEGRVRTIAEAMGALGPVAMQPGSNGPRILFTRRATEPNGEIDRISALDLDGHFADIAFLGPAPNTFAALHQQPGFDMTSLIAFREQSAHGAGHMLNSPPGTVHIAARPIFPVGLFPLLDPARSWAPDDRSFAAVTLKPETDGRPFQYGLALYRTDGNVVAQLRPPAPIVPTTTGDPGEEGARQTRVEIAGWTRARSTAVPSPTPAGRTSPTPGPIPPVPAGCQPTTTRDATGIATTNGRYGIDGSTVLSASAASDAFILVRRDVALDSRIAVEFVQIGTSAPATSVGYSVGVSARWTGWDTRAFALGVKPIGFADSCWRLIVDGTDTGLVLAIGR